MKNIYLKAGKTDAVFNDLKDSFNGVLSLNKDEYCLELKSDLAEGYIKASTFPGGITYLEFDVKFDQEVRLSMESLANQPIFFVYCSQGSLQHSFGDQAHKKVLNQNHTGILKSTASVNDIFYFEKNIPTKFSVIAINTVHDNQLMDKIRNAFLNNQEDYFHVGVKNLNISKKIDQLNFWSQSTNNLSNYDVLESIIALELQQNSDSFSQIAENINNFTLKKVHEIKNAFDFIMNIPGEMHSKFSVLKNGTF